jgi:hypothetical protein
MDPHEVKHPAHWLFGIVLAIFPAAIVESCVNNRMVADCYKRSTSGVVSRECLKEERKENGATATIVFLAGAVVISKLLIAGFPSDRT